jgi:uncharacterized protein (DUF58 family)
VSRASRIAALGLGLTALAGAFAVSPLYVPGVALLVLALAAEASVRVAASRGIVALELDGANVEEGLPAPLTVRAGGWAFALSHGELQPLPGSDWRPVSFRGTAQELALRPARRGEHLVGPATVRVGDPFGICRRELRSARGRILVLPRVERIRREQLDRALGLGRARALLDDGPDVEGLRPYRPGAPASRIHWLTVARVGELVERRAERDAEDMPFMIVLDAGSPASADALDMAVRAAASLCVAIAGLGGCSLLLPGAQEAQAIRADLIAWPYLHARLATVAAGGRPAWAVAERARSVIWVGARRPQSERAGAGVVCCTVSPLPRGDRGALFEVAGCAVQPAGRVAASAA